MENREPEMYELEAELARRKEERKKNWSIPKDPKGSLTELNKKDFRILAIKMNRLKQPTKKEMDALDNIHLI
ncbi:hypothetical protein DSO57_1014322 [Entomophthora muscae]|uniref:Uncharacterized protein n=1 Tax=Entomophthora muscae TaxID=34485 RepID=A0ACC2SI86_9FUNG|nr:hypothetical protein DSO57_1014322 [Entomophthora muscae]